VCFHPTGILDFDKGIVVGSMISGHLLKNKKQKEKKSSINKLLKSQKCATTN
jgi:hypothetical protein